MKKVGGGGGGGVCERERDSLWCNSAVYTI